jgi:hypothetical protein
MPVRSCTKLVARVTDFGRTNSIKPVRGTSWILGDGRARRGFIARWSRFGYRGCSSRTESKRVTKKWPRRLKAGRRLGSSLRVTPERGVESVLPKCVQIRQAQIVSSILSDLVQIFVGSWSRLMVLGGDQRVFSSRRVNIPRQSRGL